jgi:uncharacterized protein involved in tolerance to divalent cations
MCPKDVADKIAQVVLSEHLVACVDELPGIWGQRSGEKTLNCNEVSWLMITYDVLMDELFDTIGQLHPYKEPIITHLWSAKFSKPYADWLSQALEPA